MVRLPKRYFQRSNFTPGVSLKVYRNSLSSSRLNPSAKHIDSYRVAIRKMVALNGVRRVISAVIAPDIAHVSSVVSVAFEDDRSLLNFHSLSCSLLGDYLVKVKNKNGLGSSDIGKFLWVDLCDTALHRGLRLACLTEAYSSLWDRHAMGLSPMPWSNNLPENSLESDMHFRGPNLWDWTSGLRTDFARRLALVEIDVLVAQSFGLSLEQLLEMYTIYFPVLELHEKSTWYDSSGQIVWTSNSGLSGVGWRIDDGRKPSQSLWHTTLEEMNKRPVEAQILKCKVVDDTLPGEPREVERVFRGPFTRCDRVEDYKRAWKHFEKHKGIST